MSGNADAERECLEAFAAYVGRTASSGFGITDPAWIRLVAEDWFHADARHDHRFAPLGELLPGPHRVLDLSAGMGTALLRALERGHDAYGIEPDAGKLALARRRIAAGGLPPAWTGRLARAVGERLPYKDAAFEAVLTYQTLEHVNDAGAVLAEMLRVVRPGGALHIRCPDYRGTHEGHYRLPWLPLMPRPLARQWVRLRGRPAAGLADIRYVTRPRIERALRAAARRAGASVTILDLEAERIRGRLRERGYPSGRVWVRLASAAQWLRRLFREETPINLWVTVGASAPR